jgi:hypothetical protein
MGVVAGAVDETPPHRLKVDSQIRQHACGPTDHVGAGPAGGKLRKIGQPGLAEQVPNGAHALAYVGARP